MGTPQLNIKDAETTRLVRELVELTGESQTEAVRRAVRERLDRERIERESRAAGTTEERRREFERMCAEVRKINDRVESQRSSRHSLTEDDLYDEHGMPK